MIALTDILAAADAFAPPGDAGDFVIIEDRPVFKEHWTRELKDDETDEVRVPSKYIGKTDLEHIAKACNDRIADTNDFCTVCIGHNGEGEHENKEIVGYAGPFYVARHGRTKPKYAIFAKRMYIFRDRYEQVKRYPRVSAEYWCNESDPTRGYIDPISLLGSQTPELDLGIRYGKTRTGTRLIQYSRTRMPFAAVPGGSNVTVAGTGTKTKARIDYDKQPSLKGSQSMALTEEDIMQIVEAFTPVIDARIQDAMEAARSQPPAEDENAATDGMEPDATDPMDTMPEGEDDMPPSENDLETRPSLEGDGTDDVAMQYGADSMEEQGAPMVQKYRREVGDLRMKYRKEVAAHRETAQKYAKLQAEVGKIRQQGRRAERYQKLSGLHMEGFVFDVDEEVQDTADLSDAAFEKHCDRIVSKYQRIPSGSLPMPRPAVRGQGDDQQRREKYAKQAAENLNRRFQETGKRPNDSTRLLAEEIARLQREDSASPVPV